MKAGPSRLGGCVLVLLTLFFPHPSTVAQFAQQGPKLIGNGAVGSAAQGASVALSADGTTAIVGGYGDNSNVGAAWVFVRSNGTWTQQGNKLVGADAVGSTYQGGSVALAADGNTALVSGLGDNNSAGAAWVYTRSNGAWTQQGSKLVGIGGVGPAVEQGGSVALSADGNIAILGGPFDLDMPGGRTIGAAWVFTRGNGVWTQQGNKLVGNGWTGDPEQGFSVALSGDGNTALVGGVSDSAGAGAVWVFTRGNGVWTQQGNKLVGFDAVGDAQQGYSVALSGDGNTALVGGPFDNSQTGAAWVFVRSNGVWTQQGNKLVGNGVVGPFVGQGISVSLSADGNTALVGGYADNKIGAAWVFTRSGGVWNQQGSKLIGTGAVGTGVGQGSGVALSAEANMALLGGPGDNNNTGAAWAFAEPLQVNPTTDIASSGPHGGPFSPSSFKFTLTAWNGSVNYAISVPTWLTVSPKSGSVTTRGHVVTFRFNSSADKLVPNTYTGTIQFIDTSTSQINATRFASLLVSAKQYKLTVRASPAADGTVTGGGEIAEGSAATVTATPAPGFHFIHWVDGGQPVSMSPSYTFTMPSKAVTLVADFQKN
jgi:Divergent InlB B-repeat domain